MITMKRICCFITLMGCMLLCMAQPQENPKTAILMVHFGTSEAQGRAKSLEAINADVKQAFPNIEVRQAYASTIVRNILKKQGLDYQSPLEALTQLHDEGYERVYVQSTTLMEGIEMKGIRDMVASMQASFKEIKAGNPLLYSVDDCRQVLNILTRQPLEGNQDVVLVGHGTSHPSTATYAMLQLMLDEQGLSAWHVSTIEGYPTQELTAQHLQQRKPRKVLLIPLLLTAGDHANNDIAIEWKSFFEDKGYDVSVLLRGLGELPEIRALYIEHIKEMVNR